MISDFELKLLSADMREFPLMAAAQAAVRRCPVCKHGQLNVHSVLRTAITKYKNDKRFKKACSRLFSLPCTVAGVLIDKE